MAALGGWFAGEIINLSQTQRSFTLQPHSRAVFNCSLGRRLRVLVSKVFNLHKFFKRRLKGTVKGVLCTTVVVPVSG